MSLSLNVRDALLFAARKGFAEHAASAPGIPVCTLHSLADESIGKFVLNIVMGQLDIHRFQSSLIGFQWMGAGIWSGAVMGFRLFQPFRVSVISLPPLVSGVYRFLQ